MLGSPHPSMTPLSTKKHDALHRMLPHIPSIHHSFYEALPRQNASESDRNLSNHQIGRERRNRPGAAREKRIREDDAFLANFDQFLCVEVPKELENAQD